MDGEAWWAAVSGVAQSRTRLKHLSSISRNFVIMWFLAPISLIHFDIGFVYSMRYGFNFILLHVGIQMSQYHLLKRTFLSPLNCPGTLVEKSVGHGCVTFFLSAQFCAAI